MARSDFHDYVVEDLLRQVPNISSRAMFGGWAIYKEGIIFGLIASDQLYFKVDEQNKKRYQDRGSSPFIYEQGNHKKTTMSYWLVPYDILEEPERLAEWVEDACKASLRAKRAK